MKPIYADRGQPLPKDLISSLNKTKGDVIGRIRGCGEREEGEESDLKDYTDRIFLDELRGLLGTVDIFSSNWVDGYDSASSRLEAVELFVSQLIIYGDF